MKVWRKQTVRYTKNGKRCTKATTGAEAKTELSKRFYGTIKTPTGTTKQIPLCEDKDASEKLLRRLQTEADKDRAIGVDRHTIEQRRPLGDHLNDYEKHLRSVSNTESYVVLKMGRIRRLLNATKTKTLADLDSSRLANTLAEWRRRKKKPISIQTANHYARSIKGFSRWLWVERRMPDDPLTNLRLLNVSVDRKRVRRAFTADELQRLIQATTEKGKTIKGETWTFTPDDRAILYTLAAFTGLRASELASLTKSSFDLEAKTITVEAGYSKRRRKDVLPLHGSLLERLRPWLDRKREGKVFPGNWAKHFMAAKILKRDLKRADIEYMDEHGRYADFHSLRHTFISSLARSGVHPSKAKELARHSTSNRSQADARNPRIALDLKGRFLA